MSRLAKKPITIPKGVTVTVADNHINVSGANGQINRPLPQKIKINITGDQLKVDRLGNEKQAKANHGTTWSHVTNMIAGVQQPWTKALEIKGTGYKASVSGQVLTVTAGFINPVLVNIPEGLNVAVENDTIINISGVNKETVGQFASLVRKIRPPEPYKGKGIRYVDEFIKLKPGKAAKTQ